MKFRQVAERGGDLFLEVMTDRVLVSGGAVTVFEGLMSFKGGDFQ